METTLKQRLIGAAVIIALAVIFVPMILDGSGRQESVALNMEVPPEPTFTFDSDLPDAKKLDELEPIKKPNKPVEKEITEIEPVPDPELDSSPEPKVENTPAETTETVPVKTEEPVVAEEKVAVATENHIKTNPALSAWAVQVAAFGQKDKALALQEKLLASNLPAFTEQSGKGNKVIYRVKVGPELKRENADKLRDKILNEHGLEGSFITKHP